MPFWSQDRPGPPASHDEQQRLLRDNGLPNYSATDGGLAAGHWDRQGPRNDQPPPQYTPGQSLRLDTATNKHLSGGTVALCLFMLILGGFIAWVTQDIRASSVLSPGAIERRRLGWDRDYAQHLAQVSAMQNVTAKWAQELVQHASVREVMRKEREEWDREHASVREALREEREAWNREHASIRESLRTEREAWDREQASIREALRQERGEWDKERAKWEAERREHDRVREERKKLDLEKRRRELEKEKEDDEMKKAGLKWQDPKPEERCLRFGTRMYTSKLEHVPAGYNRIKACRETEAWINGRWVKPTQCEDGGPVGGVQGSWIVDWDEGSCAPYFQDFSDKGCTAEGSGKRRIESQVQNIRSGDDGLHMCSSTPADFHGLHFDAPHSCVYWRVYGIWGLWFIDDASCG